MAFGADVSSDSSWHTELGIAMLWFVNTHDALSIYVSPRVAYFYDSFTRRPQPTGESEVTEVGLSWSGALGGQYRLSGRFSVYGELGVQYGRSEREARTPGLPKSRHASIGTRSGVGVVLGF